MASTSNNVLEELRRRNAERDDPFNQSEARRDARRQSSKADRQREEIFEEGRKEGRQSHPSGSSRRTPAPPSARKAVSRARRSAPGRAVRQVFGPPAGQIVRLFVISLGLVVLYLVLTNASTFAGVLGWLQKATAWLVSPTATIGGHP